MLNTYLAQVAALLQNPPAPTALYSTANLTTWINTARSQIAGEGQCIQGQAGISGTGSLSYPFSSFNFLDTAALLGVINVRQMFANTSTGFIYVPFQPWEWFWRYEICQNVTPPAGTVPAVWSQQGQGASGTLWFSPTLGSGGIVNGDCIFLPVALATDSTPEAIPYPWTDCVQFLAAYYALLAAQAQARSAESDRMFARYTEFSVRARNMSTPTLLRREWPKAGFVPPAEAKAA